VKERLHGSRLHHPGHGRSLQLDAPRYRPHPREGR
jgi:hypothetical protein